MCATDFSFVLKDTRYKEINMWRSLQERHLQKRCVTKWHQVLYDQDINLLRDAPPV